MHVFCSEGGGRFHPSAVDEGQSNPPRCNSTVECLMECGGVVGVGVRNSLRGVTKESARWWHSHNGTPLLAKDFSPIPGAHPTTSVLIIVRSSCRWHGCWSDWEDVVLICECGEQHIVEWTQQSMCKLTNLLKYSLVLSSCPGHIRLTWICHGDKTICFPFPAPSFSSKKYI